MISLDTDVVLRLLVRDDPAQTSRAEALARGNDLFLAATVLLEAGWVLRSRYGRLRHQILDGFRSSVAFDRLTLDGPAAVALALDWFEGGLDFADALRLASSAAAAEFAIFDRDLGKRAARLRAAPPVRVP